MRDVRSLPAALALLAALAGAASAQQPSVFPGALLRGPTWSSEGTQAGALHGVAVARAGDVDGDGFDDALVGTSQFDGVHANEGRIELHRGGPGGLDLLPSWSVTGGQTGAWLGFALAPAGDVNGDGFDDVISGALLFDSRARVKQAEIGAPPAPPSLVVNAGRALVFHGSPQGLHAAPDWSARGTAAGALFGMSVATAGDVNGDGYDDVLVGAPGGVGYVELYLGSPSGLRAKPAWRVDGDQPDAFFGAAVSSAGDVDADGYDDLLVGAYGYEVPGVSSGSRDDGRAWLYRGAQGGPSTTAAWVQSGGIDAAFGRALCALGDANVDGYGDVAIGSPGRFLVTTQPVQVFHGGPLGLSSSADATLSGVGGRFGSSLCGADFDGDGFSDLAIGAPSFDRSFQDQTSGQSTIVGGVGQVQVWRGGPQGIEAMPTWIDEGGSPSALFGTSVAGVGDVDGDGLGDLLVGAPGASTLAGAAGAARLYSGDLETCVGLAPAWLMAGQPGDRIGERLARAGDVNADGFDDLLDSSPHALGGDGGAVVWHGSPDGLGALAAWWTANSTSAFGYGYDCDGAGDLDADGYDDVALIDLQDSGTSLGRILVFRGSQAGLELAPAWILAGTASELADRLGAAGDVNDDGFDDLAARVYGNPSLWVFRGSASGVSDANRWTVPASPSFHAPALGDVDGDGFDELYVTSLAAQPDIYFGSAAGPVAGEVFQGPAVIERLGDVNGDGFDDLAVDNAAGDVYLGSAGGPVAALEQPLNRYASPGSFSRAIAAGDLNGDGYGDVLLVAGARSTGDQTVLAFLGSQAGLERHPCWRIATGDPLSGLHPVSAAGDVDGDGFDDLALGLPTPNQAGLIVVFHGGP